MSQSIPFSVIKDFLVNGKGREQGSFQPEDDDLNAVITVLETGLEEKHLADGVVVNGTIGNGTVTAEKLAAHAVSGAKLAAGMFRLLPFTGVDGSGVEPDLTCTLTGALQSDLVAAVIKTSDFSDARSSFEAEISAAGHIEQSSLTDLSAVKFLALLIKA